LMQLARHSIICVSISKKFRKQATRQKKIKRSKNN